MSVTEPASGPVSHLPTAAEAVARHYRDASIAPSLISGLAAAFEGLLLAAAGLVLLPLFSASLAGLTTAIPVAAAVLTLLLAAALGANDLAMLRRHSQRLAKLLVAWSSVFGLVSVLLIVGDGVPQVERLWFPTWYVAGVLVLGLASALTTLVTRRLTRAAQPSARNPDCACQASKVRPVRARRWRKSAGCAASKIPR